MATHIDTGALIAIAFWVLVAGICLGVIGCAHTSENGTGKAPICSHKALPCHPINECPELTRTFDIKMGNCYQTVAVVVIFPIYDNEKNLIKVQPVPTIGEGCRCTVIVDGNPFIATFPLNDSFCEEKDNARPEERAPEEGD